MTTKPTTPRRDDQFDQAWLRAALIDESHKPSSVRTTPFPTRVVVPAALGNRFVAVIIWLIGVATTYLGFTTMASGLPWQVALPFAFGSQALLTYMERGLWRGRHVSVVTIAALLFDVLLNAGGVYPLALRLGATPTAAMFADAFHWERAISPIGAMIIAIIGGFLIAAAPEEFWSRRD